MDAKARITAEQGGHRVVLTVDGRSIETPPIEHLVFYVALAGMVQAEFIELPVALALGFGHAIIDFTRRPALVQLGEALDEA